MLTACWERKVVGLTAIAALAGWLLFYQLDEKDIWERPEARSAVSAREMVQQEEYLVPELFEQPFLDNRPPGYYWLVAAVYKVTGVETELTARVPAALAGLACVLAVYGFGCQLAGPGAGFWSGIVLLGTVKFAWQARLAEQDILLALWTCLGYSMFWQVLSKRALPWLWITLFQLSVGFGALAKGPAIVLTLLVPIALFIVGAHRWRDVPWKALLTTSPIGAGLSVWWYVYVWYALPHEHIQLLDRFLNQGNLHVRNLFYYVVELPGLLGPVTLLLPLVWWIWRDASSADRRGRLGFLLSWFLGTVSVFSLFPSKQTHYLVPAFPGLALILGWALTQHRAEQRRLQLLFVGLVMLCLVAAPVAWVLFAPASADFVSRTAAGVALIAGGAAATLLMVSLHQCRIGLAFRCSWACYLLAMGLVLGHVVPRLDSLESPRAFADRIDQVLPPEARLAVLSNHPAVAFYLDTEPVHFEHPAQARDFLEASAQHYLIVDSKTLRQFNPFGTSVVLRQDRYLKRGFSAYLLHDPD